METTTTTKCVYLSGPISDPATGLPREGWQRDFLDTECKEVEVRDVVRRRK